MSNIEKSTQYMEWLCNDNSHGYSQIRRWASQGNDRDCSSAVIEALRQGGFDTGSATYTGNLSDNLCARGWQRLSPWVDNQRGDILLNDRNHIAMYVGNGQLAEFSISETGGIDGQEGDQTGREAYIHAYYNYPWDCVLRYSGAQDNNISEGEDANAGFTYCVRIVKDGRLIWLPPVRNLEDYAGILGCPITDIAIRVSAGTLSYMVRDRHTKRWFTPVSGYNINDNANGYAGDGTEIDLVSIFWWSPDGRRSAKYRVAPIGGDYFAWQLDTDTDNGQDGYAGDDGRPIDRLQICEK